MKNGRRQRDSKRLYARGLKQTLTPSVCPACGEYGPHFVPPDTSGPGPYSAARREGFYICQVETVKVERETDESTTGNSEDSKGSVSEPISNGDDRDSRKDISSSE